MSKKGEDLLVEILLSSNFLREESIIEISEDLGYCRFTANSHFIFSN